MLPMNIILSVLKRSERESLTLLLRKLLLSFEENRFAKIKEFPIDRSEGLPKKVTVVDGSVIDSYDLCYIKVCFSEQAYY